MKDRLLTLPNLLSLSRIPLSLAAAAFLVSGDTLPMIVFAVAAILTDWLDGFAARKMDSVSRWGTILDPAADKIGFAAFGAALAVSGRIPVWFTLLVVCRDILIAAGGLAIARGGARVPRSNVWGKASTVILSAYMVRQAVHPASSTIALGLDALGLAALAGLAVSTASYVVGALRR